MIEVNICKRCGAVKEWSNGKRCKPCGKEYLLRPDVKEMVAARSKRYNQEYRARPEVKEREKERAQSPKVKEREREYRARPEVKERISKSMREYASRPEVKERIKAYHLTEEVKESKKKTRERYKDKYRERYKSLHKEYHARLEVQTRIKEYNKRPEVKAKRNEYKKIRDKKFGGSHVRRAKKRGNYAENNFSRLDIFKRDKYTCEYCKKKLTLPDCEMDHRIPIALGGAHVWENCTTSCAPCNNEKAAKLLNGVQITIFDKVKE